MLMQLFWFWRKAARKSQIAGRSNRVQCLWVYNNIDAKIAPD